MQLKKSILISFDKKWCGNSQVPASHLVDIEEDLKTAERLASFRLFLSLCLFAELFGYFFITLGLSSSRTVWIFLFGVILMIGGGILGAFFQNKSGTFLSLELQKYLKKLSIHSLEIRSFLVDKGCSESEINSLQSLPTEVYQSELNGYQRSRILNIGAPLFCGFGLFANGDLVTSFIVTVLGVLSFPIGERFFKENTFRRESELRLGLAAQLLDYVDKTYQEHIWLTAKVNLLSQLPLLLFTCKFVWSYSGQLLSSFFGLTQGLAGLTGTLVFQKSRVAAIKTTQLTTHLIQALSSPYLIVSPKRWKEHCCSQKKTDIDLLEKYGNGIFLQDFAPNVPFHEKGALSISCFIPSGSICLLKAHSGKGKSTFLSALTHIIENTGELFFIKDNKAINVHDLSREEFDSKIFYFREENIDKSARLIDLFKNITIVENESFLKAAKAHFDSLLVDLAWNAPDNLIEQEIKNLLSSKQSVFPNRMLNFLRELREKQAFQIQACLERSGGNLATERIFPERNFSTLSSGEKRRLAAVIALESCRELKTINFVILDEPLTHLDKMNIDYQLQTILCLQDLPSPPSILIISHHFIDEMEKKLLGIQEINVSAEVY